jgi:hypothetical protein
MGNMGDDFRAWDKQKKAKKRDNLTQSTQLLKQKNIEFIFLNNGIHLKVKGLSGIIDFWPSTGKFIAQDNSFTGRGVLNLINHCKLAKLEPPKTTDKTIDTEDNSCPF